MMKSYKLKAQRINFPFEYEVKNGVNSMSIRDTTNAQIYLGFGQLPVLRNTKFDLCLPSEYLKSMSRCWWDVALWCG